MRVAMVFALGLAGCAMGVGSPYVGEWRAREVVTADVCLEDGEGACAAHARITRQEPARTFWGGTLSLGRLGVSSTKRADQTSTRVRIEPTFELRRGHGRFALGLRASVVIDLNHATAIPLTAIAHASVSDRLSVHVGAGPTKYTAHLGGMRDETTWRAARGLVGFELALASGMGDRYLVFGADADVLWARFDEPHRALGATGYFGLYF